MKRLPGRSAAARRTSYHRRETFSIELEDLLFSHPRRGGRGDRSSHDNWGERQALVVWRRRLDRESELIELASRIAHSMPDMSSSFLLTRTAPETQKFRFRERMADMDQ